VVLTNVLEVDRIARACARARAPARRADRRDELIAEGLSWEAIDRELYFRA
jgi:hypothetical protein